MSCLSNLVLVLVISDCGDGNIFSIKQGCFCKLLPKEKLEKYNLSLLVISAFPRVREHFGKKKKKKNGLTFKCRGVGGNC